MNYSLYNANRMTHLKIVVVALMAATMVVGISIIMRASPSRDYAMETQIPLVKAGGPVALSDSGMRVVR